MSTSVTTLPKSDIAALRQANFYSLETELVKTGWFGGGFRIKHSREGLQVGIRRFFGSTVYVSLSEIQQQPLYFQKQKQAMLEVLRCASTPKDIITKELKKGGDALVAEWLQLQAESENHPDDLYNTVDSILAGQEHTAELTEMFGSGISHLQHLDPALAGRVMDKLSNGKHINVQIKIIRYLRELDKQCKSNHCYSLLSQMSADSLNLILKEWDCEESMALFEPLFVNVNKLRLTTVEAVEQHVGEQLESSLSASSLNISESSVDEKEPQNSAKVSVLSTSLPNIAVNGLSENLPTLRAQQASTLSTSLPDLAKSSFAEDTLSVDEPEYQQNNTDEGTLAPVYTSIEDLGAECFFSQADIEILKKLSARNIAKAIDRKQLDQNGSLIIASFEPQKAAEVILELEQIETAKALLIRLDDRISKGLSVKGFLVNPSDSEKEPLSAEKIVPELQLKTLLGLIELSSPDRNAQILSYLQGWGGNSFLQLNMILEKLAKDGTVTSILSHCCPPHLDDNYQFLNLALKILREKIGLKECDYYYILYNISPFPKAIFDEPDSRAELAFDSLFRDFNAITLENSEQLSYFCQEPEESSGQVKKNRIIVAKKAAKFVEALSNEETMQHAISFCNRLNNHKAVRILFEYMGAQQAAQLFNALIEHDCEKWLKVLLSVNPTKRHEIVQLLDKDTVKSLCSVLNNDNENLVKLLFSAKPEIAVEILSEKIRCLNTSESGGTDFLAYLSGQIKKENLPFIIKVAPDELAILVSHFTSKELAADLFKALISKNHKTTFPSEQRKFAAKLLRKFTLNSKVSIKDCLAKLTHLEKAILLNAATPDEVRHILQNSLKGDIRYGLKQFILNFPGKFLEAIQQQNIKCLLDIAFPDNQNFSIYNIEDFECLFRSVCFNTADRLLDVLFCTEMIPVNIIESVFKRDSRQASILINKVSSKHFKLLATAINRLECLSQQQAIIMQLNADRQADFILQLHNPSQFVSSLSPSQREQLFIGSFNGTNGAELIDKISNENLHEFVHQKSEKLTSLFGDKAIADILFKLKHPDSYHLFSSLQTENHDKAFNIVNLLPDDKLKAMCSVINDDNVKAVFLANIRPDVAAQIIANQISIKADNHKSTSELMDIYFDADDNNGLLANIAKAKPESIKGVFDLFLKSYPEKNHLVSLATKMGNKELATILRTMMTHMFLKCKQNRSALGSSGLDSDLKNLASMLLKLDGDKNAKLLDTILEQYTTDTRQYHQDEMLVSLFSEYINLNPAMARDICVNTTPQVREKVIAKIPSPHLSLLLSQILPKTNFGQSVSTTSDGKTELLEKLGSIVKPLNIRELHSILVPNRNEKEAGFKPLTNEQMLDLLNLLPFDIAVKLLKTITHKQWPFPLCEQLKHAEIIKWHLRQETKPLMGDYQVTAITDKSKYNQGTPMGNNFQLFKLSIKSKKGSKIGKGNQCGATFYAIKNGKIVHTKPRKHPSSEDGLVNLTLNDWAGRISYEHLQSITMLIREGSHLIESWSIAKTLTSDSMTVCMAAQVLRELVSEVNSAHLENPNSPNTNSLKRKVVRILMFMTEDQNFEYVRNVLHTIKWLQKYDNATDAPTYSFLNSIFDNMFIDELNELNVDWLLNTRKFIGENDINGKTAQTARFFQNLMERSQREYRKNPAPIASASKRPPIPSAPKRPPVASAPKRTPKLK